MLQYFQKYLVSQYSNRLLSKWIVLAFDIAVTALAFLLAYFLRFNFKLGASQIDKFGEHIIQATLVYSLSYLIFSSYAGIIRHTGLSDLRKLMKSTAAAAGILVVISLALRFLPISNANIIPLAVIIIHLLLTFVFLAGSRFFVKLVYQNAVRTKMHEKRVIIYGAGYSGLITKNALETDTAHRHKVVAFLDDDPQKTGKSINDIPVLRPDEKFCPLATKLAVDELIIAIPNLSVLKKSRIIEMCLECNLQVRHIPPLNAWIDGSFSFKQIRNVNIEDLLGRDPIHLDLALIRKRVRNKVVMVTGAAGSIGSEIVRQLLQYEPVKLVLIDQAETAMYDLEMDIRNMKLDFHFDINFQICDITNLPKITKIFQIFQPDIVYHAAAYKHVPLMEKNPQEAVWCNLFGTRNLVDLSMAYDVERFVFISTDKAVNPTNVMGATKRAAEIYVQNQALRHPEYRTRFITTRFGNVLGSNGSVIPLFMKQIESGGPVTLTHKDITRFFMTIPEACQLVLEASAMGNGGEIFMFDMGERVRIYDLARKMITLSGFVPDKDIAINIVGLRPGEKLHEELLGELENTLPTYHPKIMIASVRDVDNDHIMQCLDELKLAYDESNSDKLVKALKKLVPEFISNNSEFSWMDAPPGSLVKSA